MEQKTRNDKFASRHQGNRILIKLVGAVFCLAAAYSPLAGPFSSTTVSAKTEEMQSILLLLVANTSNVQAFVMQYLIQSSLHENKCYT